MQRDDDECTCVHRLDKLHMISEYADNVVADVVDEVATFCPVMIDLVIEQIVVRLVHIAVWSRDENLVHNDRKLLDAVEKHLHSMSRTGPAALQLIIETDRKQGDKHASN